MVMVWFQIENMKCIWNLKEKELDDQDAQRDDYEKDDMVCISRIVIIPILNSCNIYLWSIENASKNIADIAPTYFVAVASSLGSVFFIADAIKNKKSKKKDMDF